MMVGWMCERESEPLFPPDLCNQRKRESFIISLLIQTLMVTDSLIYSSHKFYHTFQLQDLTVLLPKKNGLLKKSFV